MSATATRKSPRLRPEGGGIVWVAGIHAFQCEGCGEYHELRRRREYEDPEFLASTRELLIADHTECWEFSDPQMARQARKYRKRKKLESNKRDAGLAAQRVSWRGGFQ